MLFRSVLILLLAGAVGEPVAALVPATAARARRRMSLYDDPTVPDPAAGAGLAPARAGRPPPLR